MNVSQTRLHIERLVATAKEAVSSEDFDAAAEGWQGSLAECLVENAKATASKDSDEVAEAWHAIGEALDTMPEACLGYAQDLVQAGLSKCDAARPVLVRIWHRHPQAQGR